jgi:hypothetical protein
VITEAELGSLVGTPLPGDTFRAERYEDWLLRDVVLAPPADSTAMHPLWSFIASVRAMGVSLENLFEMCGTSSDEGPMLAGCHIELAKPFVVDQQYAVTATISDAVRKQGRSGTFDVVSVDVDVSDSGGDAVATVRASYIFPRRQA